MKTLMATAAAISLLAGVSVASAENAPASNTKSNAKIEQSAAPKMKAHNAKASTHKTRVHSAMRIKHRMRDTTGSGGRVGTIGSGRNDPSIHQSVGDRDSRDYPKQH